MRAIGYARVSTEEQTQQGISLSNKEKKIYAYCTVKEWDRSTLIKNEGFSGKDLNRPGIQELIRRCRKRECDMVDTLKLDRITRSVKDLGCLVENVFNKHNVAFSSLQDNLDTSTANGRMVMNILATIAQWERDIIDITCKSQAVLAALENTSAVRTGEVLTTEVYWPPGAVPNHEPDG